MPASHRASRSRRSTLLIGVASTLALSGLVVVAAGVPSDAEATGSISASLASTSAVSEADRTSALERATRSAVRVQNAEARSERLAREKKLRQERQKRIAAQNARAERLAKEKAAREAEAKRKAAAEAAAAAEAEKARQAAAQKSSRSQVRSVAPNSGDTRAIGRELAAARGWTGEQWTCLNNLWTKESNWRTTAANPSGAYGIPQALPGSKMGSAGADWKTNPATQIKWGLGYIAGRYGTPCGAWNASQAKGWY